MSSKDFVFIKFKQQPREDICKNQRVPSFWIRCHHGDRQVTVAYPPETPAIISDLKNKTRIDEDYFLKWPLFPAELVEHGIIFEREVTRSLEPQPSTSELYKIKKLRKHNRQPDLSIEERGRTTKYGPQPLTSGQQNVPLNSFPKRKPDNNAPIYINDSENDERMDDERRRKTPGANAVLMNGAAHGAADRGAADRGAEDRRMMPFDAEDRGAEDRGAEDRRMMPFDAEDRGAEDRGAEDRRMMPFDAEDRGAEDRGAEDRRMMPFDAEDRGAGDRGAGDRGAEDLGRGMADRVAAPPLRAAFKYLHLSNCALGTTEAQVRDKLSSLCDGNVCFVKSLRTSGTCASFKIGAPPDFVELLMLPDNWPEDICIRRWQSFRPNNMKKDKQ